MTREMSLTVPRSTCHQVVSQVSWLAKYGELARLLSFACSGPRLGS
ncbi:hypothetical protein [Nonomuraea sp. NEAU-A123]|nr:hypothetical protein [Nonomuraea sp. NEAU-A123]